MLNNTIKFYLICFLALFSFIINMPKTTPVRIHWGKVNLEWDLRRPPLKFGSLTRDLELKKGLDIQGGTRLVYEADATNLPDDDKTRALEAAKRVIESRVNYFGVSESTVQSIITDNHFRIAVELPGVKDIDLAVSIIGKTAQLEFRKYKDASAEATFIPTLENTVSTGITGADMKSFQVTFNTSNGLPAIGFQTTPEGKEKFAALTRSLIGKSLIAFLDDRVISQAVVQSEIDERGQISGNFSITEAKSLTSLFNAGSLPVPLKLVEQKDIGAVLGQESINKSIRGGIVGLAIVAIFMVANYGNLGIVAIIALLVNGLLSLSLYRLIPVTLTLPGMAGFILSIGMAVDSNILVFERIKEELRYGKPWGVAMELGFGRAWESIKDANIATLITTFILFNPLNWNFLNISGLVRGFAFTLFLGIVVSLFTGIVVTRTLIRTFFSTKQLNIKP